MIKIRLTEAKESAYARQSSDHCSRCVSHCPPMLINPPSLPTFLHCTFLPPILSPFPSPLPRRGVVPAAAATAKLSVYSVPDSRPID
ncbi:hypothetical protein K0M31_004480 [Melipona bicolor]|uniref:Uncharacterized protein n=1 Tax=Melipona bicolor TaxID=60889 RepID=A0AA40KNF6_9HYME|nr:hypothetical protein K0M31_004480 [Melipona bicolor]